MPKTIQVRVDDHIKDSADMLFESLGMDTTTAIRIFLSASLAARGIPFPVEQRQNSDTAILEAINRRKTGVSFLTADEFMTNMEIAIEKGAQDASEQL